MRLIANLKSILPDQIIQTLNSDPSNSSPPSLTWTLVHIQSPTWLHAIHHPCYIGFRLFLTGALYTMMWHNNPPWPQKTQMIKNRQTKKLDKNMLVTRFITQGPRRPCNNYAVIVSCEHGRVQILSIQSKCFTMFMHCSVNECYDQLWWERLVGKDLLGALSSHRVFTLLKTGLPDPWRIPSWVVYLRASLEIWRESWQDHALQYSLLWSCHPCCPWGELPLLTHQKWLLPAVVIFLILIFPIQYYSSTTPPAPCLIVDKQECKTIHVSTFFVKMVRITNLLL